MSGRRVSRILRILGIARPEKNRERAVAELLDPRFPEQPLTKEEIDLFIERGNEGVWARRNKIWERRNEIWPPGRKATS